MEGRPSLVTIRCPDAATFQRVLRFNDDFFGRLAGISDADALERFRHCPAAYYCVVDEAESLHGYFILLPLTPECVGRLRAGEITSSQQIQNRDLACSGSPAGLYLSVVCAAGPFARSAAIAGGLQAVAELYRTGGVRYLFVRAGTEEGARMLTRLTGQPFRADGIIHEVNLSACEAVLGPRPK